MSKGDSKNAKKKNNKKTSKNKSSLSRGNKKKPGMPNVSNDLSQKLYATMEKHKEVRVDRMRNTVLKYTDVQNLGPSDRTVCCKSYRFDWGVGWYTGLRYQ